MNPNEIIGEQHLQIRSLQQNLNAALAVIKALKTGDIGLDQVDVKENGDVEVKAKGTPNGHAPTPLNRHQRRAAAAQAADN